MKGRLGCLMPRANHARGKVLGALPRALPRIPPGGHPPEPPLSPSPPSSRTVRSRPGYAEENLFKTRKGFPPPRQHRAPWTAPDPFRKTSLEKGKGATANASTLGETPRSRPPIGRHRFVEPFCVQHYGDISHARNMGTFLKAFDKRARGRLTLAKHRDNLPPTSIEME
jgi:hypothetical protein